MANWSHPLQGYQLYQRPYQGHSAQRPLVPVGITNVSNRNQGGTQVINVRQGLSYYQQQAAQFQPSPFWNPQTTSATIGGGGVSPGYQYQSNLPPNHPLNGPYANLSVPSQAINNLSDLGNYRAVSGGLGALFGAVGFHPSIVNRFSDQTNLPPLFALEGFGLIA